MGVRTWRALCGCPASCHRERPKSVDYSTNRHRNAPRGRARGLDDDFPRSRPDRRRFHPMRGNARDVVTRQLARSCLSANCHDGGQHTGCALSLIHCSPAAVPFLSLIPPKYSLFGSPGNPPRKPSDAGGFRSRLPRRRALSCDNSLYFPVRTGNSRRRPQRAAGPRLRPPPLHFQRNAGSRTTVRQSRDCRGFPLIRSASSILSGPDSGRHRLVWRGILQARFGRFPKGRW